MMQRLSAGFVAALILVGLIGTLSALGKGACDDRRDLAAIALTSLEPELSGYEHLGAFDESLETEAFSMASYLARNPNDVREVLTSAGWQRKYVVQSAQPPESPSARVSNFIFSYVTEYCDAEGASTAFGELEDETGSRTAEDVELSRSFGEEADLTADEGLDSENHQFRTLDLSFRVQNYVAGVTMKVYPTLELPEPDQEFLETLGAVLESNFEDSSEPGPGFSVTRLDPAAVVTLDDAYFRRNNVDLPLADEQDDATEIRTSGYADAVDVYQLFQDISDGSDRHLLYSLTVYRFSTDGAAETWVQDAPDLLRENPYYASIAPLSTSELSVENASVFQFNAGSSEDKAVVMVVARGQEVHRVQLVPSGGASDDLIGAAEALMQEQLLCAESGRCVAISIPDEVLQAVSNSGEGSAGTPVARA